MLVLLLLSTPPLPAAATPSPTALVRTQVAWRQSSFDAAKTGFNPFETALDPSNVAGLRPMWSEASGGISSPAIADGVAYLGSDNGFVYAIEVHTGTTMWRRHLADCCVTSSPAVYGGRLFVDSPAGLFALATKDGSVLWQGIATGDASPALANSEVYVPNSDGLTALGARTGDQRWQVWNIDFGSAAAAAGSVFAVGDEDGLTYLYAFRASDGTELWRTLWGIGGALNTPAVAKGRVFVAFTNVVYAYDAVTGDKLWTSDALAGQIEGSVAVADGAIYVGTRLSPSFSALSATSGVTLWSQPAIGSQHPAAVANGVAYVHDWDVDGSFDALDAHTGAVLFNARLGPGYGGSPVVVNGRVYVPGGRSLLALGLPGP